MTKTVIDWTKPIELSDGTPATISTRARTSRYICFEDGERQVNDDGQASYPDDTGTGSEFHPKWKGRYVRNVVEKPAAPAFDPSKPVQTRDGRKARIIATAVTGSIPGLGAFRQGDETILAAVQERDGDEEAFYFYETGRFNRHYKSGRDLMNVEPEMVDFVSIGDGYVFFENAKNALPGFPVVKIVRQGAKVVSAEVVSA